MCRKFIDNVQQTFQGISGGPGTIILEPTLLGMQAVLTNCCR